MTQNEPRRREQANQLARRLFNFSFSNRDTFFKHNTFLDPLSAGNRRLALGIAEAAPK